MVLLGSGFIGIDRLGEFEGVAAGAAVEQDAVREGRQPAGTVHVQAVVACAAENLHFLQAGIIVAAAADGDGIAARSVIDVDLRDVLKIHGLRAPSTVIVLSPAVYGLSPTTVVLLGPFGAFTITVS